MLECEENDTSHMSGVILLSSIFIGTNADNIAKFTGYLRSSVRRIAKRFRKNGIWETDNKVYCEWAEWEDPEPNVIAFVLDVLCGSGKVNRI